MTAAALHKLELGYREHGQYVLGVLARRCPFIRPADRQSVYHDAFALVLEKARGGRLDVDGMNARQLRAYLAKCAVLIALDQVRWGERAHTRPLIDSDLERADGEDPAERLADDVERAVLSEIVAELPERRQAVVKLRFFFDREPKEIQALLGISARTYRLEIERALRQIGDRYQVAREGRWCEDRRSLVLAYVAGLAGPRRAAEARRHLRNCRGCAQMAADLRLAAQKVAGLAPPPALALDDGMVTRLVDQLAVARDQAADAVGHLKQHTASIVTRADPASGGNYLAGARPGAMAATLASCVAIGGGAATYCAVDGLPDPIRPMLGVDRVQTPESAEPAAGKEPAPPTQSEPVVETAPVPPPKPIRAPAPAATTPPPEPEPEPKSDFDFERSAPTATEVPANTAAAAEESSAAPGQAHPSAAAPGGEFAP